jgi:ribosomal protein L37AE/L43A
MNQLPSCPQCGDRIWQRNVYIRYNQPEHIWAFSSDGHTVINRPEDPEALEIIAKTIWECEFCSQPADAATARRIESEFEAYEAKQTDDLLD